MSTWKSKLKSAGLAVGKAAAHYTLGWVIDRYASKKAAVILKGVLGAALEMKQNPPPDLQLALDMALKGQMPKAKNELLAEMSGELVKLLEPRLGLSEQAANLRGKK